MKTTEIKGRPYVEVNERLKYFRSQPEYKGYSLESEIIALDNGVITIKAVIRDENGIIKATGLAQEKESSSFINKTSFVENCETSAWGRALGNLGIGIDTSVASAEEVENEIVEPEVEDTVMEEPATDEENTEDSEFEEPVVEENEEESQIEEPVEETAEIIEEEDEEAEQNEPTEDVFNSPQWDNEVPTVENVIAETEEEIEEVSEPVEEESNEVVETEIEQTIEEEPEVEDVTEEDVTEQQISQPEVSEAKTEVVSPTPSAQGATAKIQDDIKSVLVYMDQLLENLPEDKIEAWRQILVDAKVEGKDMIIAGEPYIIKCSTAIHIL